MERCECGVEGVRVGHFGRREKVEDGAFFSFSQCAPRPLCTSSGEAERMVVGSGVSSEAEKEREKDDDGAGR